jgi:hypothetical protein
LLGLDLYLKQRPLPLKPMALPWDVTPTHLHEAALPACEPHLHNHHRSPPSPNLNPAPPLVQRQLLEPPAQILHSASLTTAHPALTAAKWLFQLQLQVNVAREVCMAVVNAVGIIPGPRVATTAAVEAVSSTSMEEVACVQKVEQGVRVWRNRNSITAMEELS